jgi:hypothetical protein
MRTGSYFTIGTTHTICEDYALAGPNYAIICDGCSNANGPKLDADWGARILAKAAEERVLRVLNQLNISEEVADLHTASNYYGFVGQIINTADIQRRAFATLQTNCLTATLGLAYAYKTDINVILAGDGVFGGKKRDGTYEFHVVEFLPGGESCDPAPFYLRYLLHPQDLQNYIRVFGGQYKHTIYTGTWEAFGMSETLHEISAGEIITSQAFLIADFEYVFVGSDGLFSHFYKTVKTETSKHPESLSILEVLEVLLDFSNYAPGFVETQCLWVFKRNQPKTFPRLDWHNGDDVSIGVIYCGDEGE